MWRSRAINGRRNRHYHQKKNKTQVRSSPKLFDPNQRAAAAAKKVVITFFISHSQSHSLENSKILNEEWNKGGKSCFPSRKQKTLFSYSRFGPPNGETQQIRVAKWKANNFPVIFFCFREIRTFIIASPQTKELVKLLNFMAFVHGMFSYKRGELEWVSGRLFVVLLSALLFQHLLLPCLLSRF